MTAPLPPTTASDAELVAELRRVIAEASMVCHQAGYHDLGEGLDEKVAPTLDRLDKLSAEVAAKDAALALWSESIIMSDDGRPISIRDIGMGYGGDVAMAAQATRAALSPRMEADNG